MKRSDFGGARKDKRHAPRRKASGIAIRSCVIADVSASGIRLIVTVVLPFLKNLS